MNFATRALLELQETTLLAARAFRGIFKRPRYIPETIAQMDAIGVGSLTIIILTGFFTGGVLTVQTFPTLKGLRRTITNRISRRRFARSRTGPRVVRADGNWKSRLGDLR